MEWDDTSIPAFFKKFSDNIEKAKAGIDIHTTNDIEEMKPRTYKLLREYFSISDSQPKPSLEVRVCASEIVSQLARLSHDFSILHDGNDGHSHEWLGLILVR
jgi:hypothetical protein